MNRLYEPKANEEQWEVVKKDNGDDNDKTYILENKKNKEIYFFRHVIGFEQVAEDEFLTLRKLDYNIGYQIARYKLQKSELKKIFSKRFSQFCFISNDRIMFTDCGAYDPYRCKGIYSIKDNSMLKEAEWLTDDIIDINNDVYKDVENPNKIILCFKKETIENKLNNPKIVFTIDPNTLQPNSYCYSQLRDSYIKVNSKEDINNIVSEDKKYIIIIEKHLYQREYEQLEKAKTRLLARNKQSE